MSATADAVVIGAGVIGSSAAYELARLGFRVVVVDKAGGEGHGSTSASSAIVRFNYSTRDAVATAWESKHCWDRWADHLGAPAESGLAAFRRTGMALLDVDIAPAERVLPLFDSVGVPYERWDAATLRTRIPGIDTGRYWPPKSVDDPAFFADATEDLGAVYTPDAGFIDDPQLAARNLADAARRRGALFLFNRGVVAVSQHGGRVYGVALSDGSRIDAPVLVNAAGPWSGAINRLAGVGTEFTIGVRPMRQEVHQIPAPEGYAGPCIADMDLGTYLRPAPGGQLLVGGTEPECDPFEWIDDPDQASPYPTAARFEAQVLRAARRLTDVRVPNAAKGIAGVYDVADDWTPIYDRTDLPGFYVAMGTSGNQFKNAPLAGRFVATLVQQVEAGHDHDNNPVRYECEHTGHVVSLGAFSRKRPFNKDSSGTVMG
ncbi:NAD(P)/FAD-dependent oxidoreductase [Actinocrispum wychmicini]|uniref:Glycine/D-amino acid oxidase-like deaminating enzyme n=1 Tax=Actinocrispum wychmicini TaxID=1213861 RepID=A0A4R2JJ50_9PSEU|nr:FAD-dependent oxidoreductase [Actinocrispum wychmicini]TCO54175.1 glycine/D-amino acid oxidase-like deaminating enzyme [Actinocrispum wychmicini]